MLTEILLAIAVLAIIAGLGFGLFTRKGSGIESHPDSSHRR